jgi:hypothetical protein
MLPSPLRSPASTLTPRTSRRRGFHHLELNITDSSGKTHRALLDAPLTVAGRPKQIRRVERNEQGQISRIVDE